MKRVIFYLLIVPNYFSLLTGSIMSKDYWSILILCYLIGLGMYVSYVKSINFASNFLVYINCFIVYPILLGLSSNEISSISTANLSPNEFLNNPSMFFTTVLVADIACIVVLILIKYLSLHREILYFFLIIFTLNTSLFELYIHIEKYVFSNIVFHFILNILMITTPKSFKIIKKPKAKKVKKTEE